MQEASVQETLEKLLSNLFKESISLQSSGRTDAGVHAFNQIAHFSLPKMISLSCDFPDLSKFQKVENTNAFKILLNLLKVAKKKCPKNIQIKKAFLVDDDFHALRSAVDKTYTYFISSETTPFNSSQIYNIGVESFTYLKKNIHILQQLAATLIGEKDFKSFQNTGTPVKNTVRNIFESSWQIQKTTPPQIAPISLLGAPAEYLEFNITGNGFLKQMVRNIVGCQLYLIQKKSEPLKHLQSIIEQASTQKIFAPAPPQGLYLRKINYPASLDKFPLKI